MAQHAAGEAVAATLREQLVDVRRSLVRHPVPGDGNCQFRSVAIQCRSYAIGGGTSRLRRRAVDHVASNPDQYLDFFLGSELARRRALTAWLSRMASEI